MGEDLDAVFTSLSQWRGALGPCLPSSTSAEQDRVPPHYSVLYCTSREQLIVQEQPPNNNERKTSFCKKYFYIMFQNARRTEMWKNSHLCMNTPRTTAASLLFLYGITSHSELLGTGLHCQTSGQNRKVNCTSYYIGRETVSPVGPVTSWSWACCWGEPHRPAPALVSAGRDSWISL